MKLLLLAYSFILITFTSAFAQTNGPLSITPVAHPGSVLNVNYNSTGTLLNNQPAIIASIYLFSKNGSYYAENLNLIATGNIWDGKITIPDSIVFVGIKLSANNVTDNNDGKGYFISMVNDKNQPVDGEKYVEAILLNGFGQSLFGMQPDVAAALSSLEQQLSLYPQSRKDILMVYRVILSNNKKWHNAALVQQEMLNRFNDPTATETELSEIYNGISPVHQKALSDSLANVLTTRFPGGALAATREAELILKIPLLKDRIAAYNAVKAEYKIPEEIKDRILLSIAYEYLKKRDYANYDKYVADIKNRMPLMNLLNEIAWKLTISNQSPDVAARLSKQSLDIIDNTISNPPDFYKKYTPLERAERLHLFYAMFADTYALILYKQGKLNEALTYQQKAVDFSDGSDTGISEHYIQYLVESGKTTIARLKCDDFIKQNKYSNKIKNQLKELYAKQKGSDNGFDDYFALLKSDITNTYKTGLMAQMLSQNAPPFTLRDLNGDTVSLASLKGKIVVVDFWATWCGPCRISFPAMQTVINKYKKDDNVKFLFIDTHEPGLNRLKLINNYLVNNNYNFKVLLDEENGTKQGEFNIAANYGVEAVPTRFVIDRAGLIRFKTAGISTYKSSDLVNELVTMIELAANPTAQNASTIKD